MKVTQVEDGKIRLVPDSEEDIFKLGRLFERKADVMFSWERIGAETKLKHADIMDYELINQLFNQVRNK